MVEHLYKAHHVKTTTLLVQKWKDRMKRQVWSCGFCVTAFDIFEIRVNHIAWHFEQGRTIDEWDTTKVIQGLLQQPGVIEAWKELAASQLVGEVDCCCWKKYAIKALRRDLEVGPNPKKTARDLAEAAFAASEVNYHKWAEILGIRDSVVITDADAFD